MAKIGIDLGTYNSAAAYITPDGPRMVAPEEGNTLQGAVFPSFVEFSLAGDHLCTGQTAALHLADKPQQVIWGTKRLIGKPYDMVEEDLRHFAYNIREAKNGSVEIVIGNARYTPMDIAIYILQKIRHDIEGAWNPLGSVDGAVITHPAYFDTAEINATRDAANEAGFKQVELIAEPIAATLAFQLEFEPGDKRIILTIDWGAGTLDIVLATIACDESRRLNLDQPNPPHGDMQLGGLDMDDMFLEWAIAKWGLEEFAAMSATMKQRASFSEENIRSQTSRELNAFRRLVEETKIGLSKFDSAPFNFVYQGAPRQELVSRADLEEAIASCVEKAAEHISYMLSRSGLSAKDIDHVLLVGGPMHIPIVRRVINNIFASNENVVNEMRRIEEKGFPVSPMEAVAIGAAFYAQSVISGPETPGLDKFKRSKILREMSMRNVCTYQYSVALEEVNSGGETIVVYKDIAFAGQEIPCEVEIPRKDYLQGDGSAEESRPVKLLKKSIDLETIEKGSVPKEIWKVMGDYKFIPFWRDDGTAFYKIKGDVDKDGVVSLTFSGEEGIELELKELSKLHGKPLQGRPLTEEEHDRLRRQDALADVDKWAEAAGIENLPLEQKLAILQDVIKRERESEPLPFISRDKVTQLHAQCDALLKEAQQELHSPSTTEKQKEMLAGRVTVLQAMLSDLPSSLSTEKTEDKRVRTAYSRAAHASESLQLALDQLKS